MLHFSSIFTELKTAMKVNYRGLIGGLLLVLDETIPDKIVFCYIIFFKFEKPYSVYVSLSHPPTHMQDIESHTPKTSGPEVIKHFPC